MMNFPSLRTSTLPTWEFLWWFLSLFSLPSESWSCQQSKSRTDPIFSFQQNVLSSRCPDSFYSPLITLSWLGASCVICLGTKTVYHRSCNYGCTHFQLKGYVWNYIKCSPHRKHHLYNVNNLIWVPHFIYYTLILILSWHRHQCSILGLSHDQNK